MRERPAVPALATDGLAPGLYLVATPIGNLRDITLRALDVLSQADLVLAEDTRVSGRLLQVYGISTRLERYDDHSDHRVAPQILERLRQGERLALISDAGTPMISDPGYRLVAAAVAEGFGVFPIPGASAVLSALTVAGLPTDRFLFVGFLPPKSAARVTSLQELVEIRATLVFYETGPRLAASLADMARVLGPRPAMVGRELTKLHETCLRGGLDDLARDPGTQGPRGELVVVVAPPDAAGLILTSQDLIDQALLEALSRLPPAAAAAEVAATSGQPRRDLYRRALGLRQPE